MGETQSTNKEYNLVYPKYAVAKSDLPRRFPPDTVPNFLTNSEQFDTFQGGITVGGIYLITPTTEQVIRSLTPYEAHWFERGFIVKSVIQSYLEWFYAEVPSADDE